MACVILQFFKELHISLFSEWCVCIWTFYTRKAEHKRLTFFHLLTLLSEKSPLALAIRWVNVQFVWTLWREFQGVWVFIRPLFSPIKLAFYDLLALQIIRISQVSSHTSLWIASFSILPRCVYLQLQYRCIEPHLVNFSNLV